MITNIGKVANCCCDSNRGKLGFDPENDPTKATSTPDYDNWFFDTWWTASDWMSWHKALKLKYVLEEANSKFIIAWQKQSIGAGPIDARSFDSTFRDYAKDNGFLEDLYWGSGFVAKPLGATVDLITGISSGFSTTASISRYFVPVIAITFALLAFNVYAPRRRY